MTYPFDRKINRRKMNRGQTTFVLRAAALRLAAFPATGAGETMGEDAAVEIAAELVLDVDRHRIAIAGPVAGEREPGLKVGLHGAISASTWRMLMRRAAHLDR